MNRLACRAVVCICLFSAIKTRAQDLPQSNQFSRKNTFTLFAEYSNTSSHILLGYARQRTLADFGGAYTRRVVRFWGSDLGYHVEVRPVLFESDPLDIETEFFSVEYPPPTGTVSSTTISSSAPSGKCIPASGTLMFNTVPGEPTVTGNYTTTCGRQWTFGQAFSPIGFKYSMRARHPLQPFVIGTLGYMYTSRPVPIFTAEAFNFVFDFGAGLELFHSETKKRSISLEARYHHFSNRDTAEANPGTDNIVYKISYSFGH
jgi:hypothetical protein